MLNRLKTIIENQKKDILRLSLRSAIAAVLTYVIISYIKPDQAFLAILSSVFIINYNIGSTLSAAKNRFLSTLLGCILGFLAVWLLPYGWGTSIALAVSMLLLNAIAAVKSEWRYGVVAAIAISLGSEANAIEISIDKLFAIGAGAGVGVLVSFIIMPHKAEVRAINYMRKAIQDISDRFKIVMHNTKTEEGKSPKNAQHRFYSNIGRARGSAKYIKFYDSGNIWNCIDAIERMHNSVIIVDRIAAKTKTEIGGESSGITNNVDEFMENVTNLLDKISKSEFDNDSEFEDLEASISKIRSDVKLAEDKQDILNMQHTFLFAIEEIRENLKITNNFFEKA